MKMMMTQVNTKIYLIVKSETCARQHALHKAKIASYSVFGRLQKGNCNGTIGNKNTTLWLQIQNNDITEWRLMCFVKY